MDVQVRVYFKSEIMAETKFLAKHLTDKISARVIYFFRDLPICFSTGQFFMDAINGVVPYPLEEFESGKYSIHEIMIAGFRQNGLYHDEQFGEAEAEVRQIIYGRDEGRSIKFDVDVEGADLGHVLGLYHAIINDELLPVSVGKSPVQIIEELKANLLNSERVISELTNNVNRLENKVALNETLFRSHNKERVAAGLEVQARVDSLLQMLDQADRPWYRRHGEWLIFLLGLESNIEADNRSRLQL